MKHWRVTRGRSDIIRNKVPLQESSCGVSKESLEVLVAYSFFFGLDLLSAVDFLLTKVL